VSNQAWWRIVVVISSLSIGAAAVACCYLLKSEPPSKYESLTVKQDGFFGRFNRETGEFDRVAIPPLPSATHDWSAFPLAEASATGWINRIEKPMDLTK